MIRSNSFFFIIFLENLEDDEDLAGWGIEPTTTFTSQNDSIDNKHIQQKWPYNIEQKEQLSYQQQQQQNAQQYQDEDEYYDDLTGPSDSDDEEEYNSDNAYDYSAQRFNNYEDNTGFKFPPVSTPLASRDKELNLEEEEREESYMRSRDRVDNTNQSSNFQDSTNTSNHARFTDNTNANFLASSHNNNRNIDNNNNRNIPNSRQRHNRHKSTLSQTSFHPLILGTANSPLSLQSQKRDEFKLLLKSCLSCNLSPQEDELFLERFRYILVTSSLLDNQKKKTYLYHPQQQHKGSQNGHIDNQRKKGESKESLKSKILLRSCPSFCECSVLPDIQLEKKYWIDAKKGSGFVVVVIAFLTWATTCSKLSASSILNNPKLRNELITRNFHLHLYQLTSSTHPPSPERSVALVIISFGMFLLLFSYSRRKNLRLMRLKTIKASQKFIESSSLYDSSMIKSFGVLKELELVSKGYRPDLALGTTNKTKTSAKLNFSSYHSKVLGKHLRSSLSAGLYLLCTQLADAIHDIYPYCNELDLAKYLDIYDLDLTILQEFGWWTSLHENHDDDSENKENDKLNFFIFLEKDFVDGIPKSEFFGTAGSNASLSKLKLDFYKLQFLRKVFICCLLSIWTSVSSSSSSPASKNKITSFFSKAECSKWEKVAFHLQSLHRLSSELAQNFRLKKVVEAIGFGEKQVSSDGVNTSFENLDRRERHNSIVWKQQMRSLNHIFSSLQHIEARMEILRDTSIGILLTAEDKADKTAIIDNENADDDEDSNIEEEFENNFDMVGAEIQELMGIWNQSRLELQQILQSKRNNNGQSNTSPDTSKDSANKSQEDSRFFDPDDTARLNNPSRQNKTLFSAIIPGNINNSNSQNRNHNEDLTIKSNSDHNNSQLKNSRHALMTSNKTFNSQEKIIKQVPGVDEYTREANILKMKKLERKQHQDVFSSIFQQVERNFNNNADEADDEVDDDPEEDQENAINRNLNYSILNDFNSLHKRQLSEISTKTSLSGTTVCYNDNNSNAGNIPSKHINKNNVSFSLSSELLKSPEPQNSATLFFPNNLNNNNYGNKLTNLSHTKSNNNTRRMTTTSTKFATVIESDYSNHTSNSSNDNPEEEDVVMLLSPSEMPSNSLTFHDIGTLTNHMKKEPQESADNNCRVNNNNNNANNCDKEYPYDNSNKNSQLKLDTSTPKPKSSISKKEEIIVTTTTSNIEQHEEEPSINNQFTFPSSTKQHTTQPINNSNQTVNFLTELGSVLSARQNLHQNDDDD